MRQAQRGFTLIEMMVVVVILATLVALAIVYLKPHTKAVDVSYSVAELVHEASREAMTYGPVRADVALARGSKARTCIVGAGAVAGQPTFTLNVLLEDALPASTFTWTATRTYTTPTSVFGDSWSTGIGSHASVTLNTSWPAFNLCCYPDGTCDARSLFFQSSTQTPSYDLQSRLSVLPLGAATLIKSDWN